MTFLILLLYLIAAALMAFAWIGHLKFEITFFQSILWSVMFIIVEYSLFNYGARLAHKLNIFTPLQTSFISLAMGAFFLAIVAFFFLGEKMSVYKLVGTLFVVFGLLIVIINPTS